MPCADPEGGGGVGWGGVGDPEPPLKKSQKYRVSQQYWSGFLENHKATIPSQHSMMGYHRHVSEMPFNGVLLADR